MQTHWLTIQKHTDSPTLWLTRHSDSPDTLTHYAYILTHQTHCLSADTTHHADTSTHHANTLTHQTHYLYRYVSWGRYITHVTCHVSYVILTVANHDDVTVRHRIEIRTVWGQRQTDVGRRLWWRGHRRWWRGHRRWWRGNADVRVAAGSGLASVVDVGTGGRGLLPPTRPCRAVVPGATWRHVTRKGRATQSVINEKVTNGKGGGEDELQHGWDGGCNRKGGVGQYNGREVRGCGGANRTQTIWSMGMLCVQNTDNTDQQNTDKQNTDNSHGRVVCTEHKQNTNNSHCHFVRAEHSWAVTWTCPSAVPTTPCGNCSSRTERGTSTVCDTAACWSVGTDPSRLLWHQDGQTLTQWGTAHHTPTADRSKRAKLLPSPSSLSCSLFVLPSFCLLSSLCLSYFFVLSVFETFSFFSILPSSFLLSFPFRRVLNSREISWLARCSRARYDLHSKETTATKQP